VKALLLIIAAIDLILAELTHYN